MGNHGSRPEVVAGSVAGLGKDTRLSSTVRREMLYTAVLIEDEGVPLGIARVAAPTSQIHSNVNRIIATMSVSALIVAVSSITLGYFKSQPFFNESLFFIRTTCFNIRHSLFTSHLGLCH